MNYVINFISSLLLILFTKSSMCLGLDSMQCAFVSYCKCVYPNGMAIDLTPLNILPERFIAVSSPSVAYFYHPCSDEKLVKSDASDSGGVLYFYASSNISTIDINTTEIVANGTGFTRLATAKLADFEDTDYEKRTASLVYNNSPNWTTTIHLECFNGQNQLKIESTNLQNHELTLKSPHCCPKLVEEGSVSHTSTGSVLLVMFFSIAIAYFVGGALVLKFIRGAQGTEMIPNYEFWSDLPNLVRDGWMYLCCSASRMPDAYERI